MKSYLYGASAEYALHSLLIMLGRKEAVSVRDLARFQKLPERFLAKLFTRLKQAGIVVGIEGISGGFMLARPAGEIAVMDVLDAIDPNRTLFECAEIRRKCELFGDEPPSWSTTGPCRIHHVMLEAEQAMRSVLRAKSLADLGDEFQAKAPEQFMQDAENWFKENRNKRNTKTSKCQNEAMPSKPCSSGNPCQRHSKTKEKQHE